MIIQELNFHGSFSKLLHFDTIKGKQCLKFQLIFLLGKLSTHLSTHFLLKSRK